MARPSTHTRIVDAAVAVIERFGLTRFTMEDVAEGANLTRQTIYRYFPSKPALIEAIIDREKDALLSGLASEFATADTVEAALALGSRFAMTTITNHPVLVRLLEHEPEAILPYLTTGAGDSFDTAATGVGVLLADRADVPIGVARPIADVFVRLVVSYALTPSVDSVERVSATISTLITAALRDGARA